MSHRYTCPDHDCDGGVDDFTSDQLLTDEAWCPRCSRNMRPSWHIEDVTQELLRRILSRLDDLEERLADDDVR